MNYSDWQIKIRKCRMNYANWQIKIAKEVGAFNVTNDIWNKKGFWFDGVYITNPFLDKQGTNELNFSESIAYYGADNINKFMDAVMKDWKENKNGEEK